MDPLPSAGVFDPELGLSWPGGASAARFGAIKCAVDGWVSNAADPAATVASAYARAGEAALRDLRGDFVIYLWDHDAQRGLIARDQLGGRSLYFCREGRSLLFAPEVRDLLQALPRTPSPDRTALLQWLSVNHNASRQTFYEGVEALLPGELVRFGSGRAEVAAWWRPRYAEPRERSRDAAAEAVEVALELALERSLGDRSAVGVLLSGGLDSTSLAALGQARTAMHGYSGVFPDMQFVDESGLIDLFSERSGVPVTRMAIHGGSMLRSGLRFSRDWRLPLASQNLEHFVPLLERAAADGSSLMLDGEGGDLLFAARPELIGDRLRRGRLAGAIGLARALPGGGEAPWRSVMEMVAATGGRAALPAALHDAMRGIGSGRRHAPEWIRAADAGHVVETDGLWAWKRLDGPRWWARLAYALTDGLHAVGVRDHTRRRALAGGLETRSPFFDVDLVETMLSLAPEYAFGGGGLSRRLQREAMAGRLPEEIRRRPEKSYFDQLFYRGLGVEDAAAVNRLLTAPDAELRAWVDLDAVRLRLLDPGPKGAEGGARYWLKAVWRLAAAECWLREQSDPGFADRLIERERLSPPRTAFVEPARTAA